MPPVQLRPYQDDLVGAIRAGFARHRRVLAVAPTGAGKTVTFAYITNGAAAKGNPVIIVAHRAEIVAQISGALDAMGVRHGRIQPGHTMTNDIVQVAMIQTLARRLDRVPAPALLVIDECHHAVAGTWSRVTNAWPSTKILGVTATPARLDGRGLGNSFDTMVIGPLVRDLIEAGFLAKFTYLAPPQQVDLSSIKTEMGDYALSQLADAMDKSTITGDAMAHYRDHLGGRPAVAFCVTVAHAEHVAAQFVEAGYRAASVDGTMSREERLDRIQGIGNGRYQVLTSCELISEGVDVPVVSGAILLRPTKSLGMYLQQVGRVLRPKPDGSAAVILDHVGNVHRHGMPDAEREWTLDTKKRDPCPVAQCDVCFRVYASGQPNWRAGQECGGVGHDPCEEYPEGCVLIVLGHEAPAPRDVEHVDGQLEIITSTPAWAGGADISRGPLAPILAKAQTMEQLQAIAKVRGYHHRWISHILTARSKAYG